MRRLLPLVLVTFAMALPMSALSSSAQVSDPPSYLLRLIAGLVLVLIVVVVLAWVLKRFGGTALGRAGPIQVLGSAPVGQRERVVLVEVGGEQLLIGVAPGSVRRLHLLAEEADVHAPDPPERAQGMEPYSFRAQLHSILRRGRGGR